MSPGSLVTTVSPVSTSSASAASTTSILPAPASSRPQRRAAAGSIEHSRNPPSARASLAWRAGSRHACATHPLMSPPRHRSTQRRRAVRPPSGRHGRARSGRPCRRRWQPLACLADLAVRIWAARRVGYLVGHERQSLHPQARRRRCREPSGHAIGSSGVPHLSIKVIREADADLRHADIVAPLVLLTRVSRSTQRGSSTTSGISRSVRRW